jgi:DeoR/GlpR family transcriptional regulator of sugar metabolism
VVADHTKWGVRGLSRIAEMDEVDVFVSDSALPPDARDAISGHVDRLVITGESRRRHAVGNGAA